MMCRSKSESRAQAASVWVDVEIEKLKQHITNMYESNCHNSDEINEGNIHVTFGEVFREYQGVLR
jgi:hypothetical protein